MWPFLFTFGLFNSDQMNQIVFTFKNYTPRNLRFFFRKLRRLSLYCWQSSTGMKLKKKYHCPVSEKNYRTFIKDSGSLVSLDLGARQRHRFIWHYLKSETPLFVQNEIYLLHISPEFCFYEKLKTKKNIRYSPVDKFEPGYDYPSFTKDFDLLNENSESEKYDFIICNHVLEHIIDDKTAIKNLYKLLKPGGNAIVTVPILPGGAPTYEDYSITSPKERKKHFGQWDHVRYYGTDINNRFQDAGFSVKAVNSVDYFEETEREKFGAPGESWLFHLTKPIK